MIECFTAPDGSRKYFRNLLLHREDGPAVDRIDGTKEWWVNGKLHRVDGPAYERLDGTKEWWVNGKLHRENGPAWESAKGIIWMVNGEIHRADGPAIELSHGSKQWFLRNKGTTEQYISALCAVRKIRNKNRAINSALGFDFHRMLCLVKSKAFIEWYYSPDNTGGKLSKERISGLFIHTPANDSL